MTTETSAEPAVVARRIAEGTAFSIILALSFSHMLNDMMQSLVPALYPMIKGTYGLSFVQIGLMTTAMQVTSSMLQPVVGLVADRRPQPYSLSVGMAATFVGVLLLAQARPIRPCCSARRWSGSARRCFTPRRRASRGWRRAGGTAS